MNLQDFRGLQEAYVGVYEARIDDHQNLDPIEKEFVRYKRQTGFEPSSDIDKKTEIRRQVHREKRGAKKREPYRDSSTVSGRFRSSDQNRKNIETLKSRRLSRTSFNNIRNFQREDLDIHDLILSHLLEAYVGVYEDLNESSLADLFSAANKKIRDEDESITKAQAKRIERSKKLAAAATGDSTVPTSSSSRKRKPGEALKDVQKTIAKIRELEKESENVREDLDIYDLILSHLLDEGYANTPKAAEIIMENLSEGAKTEFAMRALGTATTGAKRVAKALNKSKTVKNIKGKVGRFVGKTVLGALTGIPLE